MAGGWTRDGAVQDQIDDTVKDAVAAARARLETGEGADWCDECGEQIPAAHRQALPRVRPALSASSSATSTALPPG